MRHYRRANAGCWILLALLLRPAAASAQLAPPHRPIRFERATVEPFLPQSSVYVIHQDRRGFLWFGTREGLGRWDGAAMRTWKATPFEPNALPGNLVRRLVEDRDGHLWIGTQRNDRQPLRVARLSAPDHETVQVFSFDHAVPFLDRDARAWVVDRDSLWRFDGERLIGMRPRLSNRLPYGAYTDRAGTIWVADEAGGIERYPRDGAPTHVMDAEPRPSAPDLPGAAGFFEDDRGTLWVLGQGLRQLDETRSRLVSPDGLPAALDTVGTGQLLQDPDGWLWLASLDGIYRFDPALSHFERYSLRLPGDVGTQNWAVAVSRDRSGAIWAGTVWGLHRYDPAVDVFGFLEHDPDDANTIGSGIVMALHEDPDGSLWVGTLGGGLNRIDRQTGTVQRFRHREGDPSSLGHDWVWALAGAGNGRVWAGLPNGLVLVDPNTLNAVSIDLGPVDPEWLPAVMALHAEPDGGLWIGGSGRLFYRSPAGEMRRIALPVRADVNAILSDGADVWIATNAGLARLDPHTGAARVFRHDPADRRSLSNDIVITVFRDRGGTLWAGTTRGLDRLEADSGFAHFNERAGFPSSVIYSILEDDDARLWLATNRGLVRFDPAAAAEAVRVYDAATGVGNVEFNRNAALQGRDGTFYFGGDGGVTLFHPASLRDNDYRPPVVVTALHRSTREGTRTTRYVGNDAVVLAPEDYTVAFELAALSFTQPQRNRYAYRLEGFDARWVNAGTNRLASYTNLPPGRYTFRARAANEDGRWNEEGVALRVIVQPWFWETWWFRLLALAAVITAAATVTSAVQRNRHRRQLEALRHQRALDDERARISRDMHDEVGASLTEIAILSELAVRRHTANGGQRTELDKIAGRSRRMLDAIGEIIWALNPDHDRPDHLAAYLREYTANYLESAGIRADLRFDAGDDLTPLTSDFRRNVFLVLKEALANVVKHSGAHDVCVELIQQGGRLVLRVLDDGGGGALLRGAASATSAAGHHGLGNMQQRARALGGALTVGPRMAGGTRVELNVPLPSGMLR